MSDELCQPTADGPRPGFVAAGALRRNPLESRGADSYSAHIGSRIADPRHERGSTMNATARTLTLRPSTRLASATLAALITFGVVATLSQSLHVERLGEGSPLVQLERVTVTAQRATVAPAVASIPATTRSN
jgi:hypothetical protein